jgi:hypothetical protein
MSLFAIFVAVAAASVLLGVALGRLARIEPTWTSLDGRRTPIRKLDDKHLCNIIRMLRRDHRDRLALRLHYELTHRSLPRPLHDEPLHPLWPYLIKEARKRGLTC